jgi:hypothetical protein
MIKAAILALPLLGLGACASQVGYFGDDRANQQLGSAVRQNIAAQTVNPTPSNEPVVASGVRVAGAVVDYQADKTEKPASSGTSAVQASAAE